MKYIGLKPQEEKTPADGKALLGGILEQENSTGDWRSFLPVFEAQHGTYFDTSMCTNFTCENQIVMLIKKKYGLEPNYSERFMAVTSGTKPGIGNYASNANNSPKSFGMVEESVCPWNRDRNAPAEEREVEFVFRPIKDGILELGRKWPVEEFEYNWNWVQRTGEVDHSILREALKISPVGVSIALGKKDASGVFQRTERQLCHRVTATYVHPDGKVDIFDHYHNNKTRTLSADYIIGWPSYITLNQKNMPLRLVQEKGTPHIYALGKDKTIVHIGTMSMLVSGASLGLWKETRDLEVMDATEISKYEKRSMSINLVAR